MATGDPVEGFFGPDRTCARPTLCFASAPVRRTDWSEPCFWQSGGMSEFSHISSREVPHEWSMSVRKAGAGAPGRSRQAASFARHKPLLL